jgi:CAAX protease family protein
MKKIAGDSRTFSAFEFLIGAFIVIAHNVFRIIPNEVPILTALALLSIYLRNRSWAAIGLKRPESWMRVLLIALAAAAVRIVGGELVISPLAQKFWPPAIAPAGSENLAGNLNLTLRYLGLAWIWAALGEEISYRGYLLHRAAEIGGKSNAAYIIAMILVSILFGFGHYYKGPTGVVDSTFSGLILGTAFLLAKRNLWASILAHGIIDSTAIILVFSGVATPD